MQNWKLIEVNAYVIFFTSMRKYLYEHTKHQEEEIPPFTFLFDF